MAESPISKVGARAVGVLLLLEACASPCLRAATDTPNPVEIGSLPTPAPVCPFVDVMPTFYRYWDGAASLPETEKVARFKVEVVAAYPKLFRRAVLGYDDSFTIDDAFTRFLHRHDANDIERMRSTSARLRDTMPGVLKRFRETFPTFRCDAPV